MTQNPIALQDQGLITPEIIQACCALATLFLGVILAILDKRRRGEIMELANIVKGQENQLSELKAQTSTMIDANELMREQNSIHATSVEQTDALEARRIKLANKPRFIKERWNIQRDGRFELTVKNVGKPAMFLGVVMLHGDEVIRTSRQEAFVDNSQSYDVHHFVKIQEGFTHDTMTYSFAIVYEDINKTRYYQEFNRQKATGAILFEPTEENPL